MSRQTMRTRLISGAVRTCKLLDDGRRQIGAFHLKGDAFGLESGSTHRLTAEAIADTTVRLVRRRSLEIAADTNVQVARNLWTMTAHDLRHAENHMLLLGRKTAMERVATFLREMDCRLAVAGMCALPMRRRDIGDFWAWRSKRYRERFPNSTMRAYSSFVGPAKSCFEIVSACPI